MAKQLNEYVQLVGSDDPGASGAALVWANQTRLCVNCPEGMQRYMGELRSRLPRVTHCRFTRVEPGSFMGLPGVLFTVNDGGVKKLAVVGDGAALARMWAVIHRHFFLYRRLHMTILDAAAADDAAAQGDGSEGMSPAAAAATTRAAAGLLKTDAYHVHPVPCGATAQSAVVSYLCVLPLVGKFLPAKAKALGVKPGPKFAQLKRGEAVLNDAEPPVLVQPAAVMEQAAAGSAVLVADCSEPARFPALALLAAEHSCAIHTVVHVAPHAMAASAGYRAAVDAACGGGAVKHVYAAQDYHARLTAFPTALAHRHHLAFIAPDCVSVPAAPSLDAAAMPRWPYAARHDARRAAEAEEVPIAFPSAASALAMMSPEFAAAHKHAAAAPAAGGGGGDAGDGDGAMQMRFFGTGSAVPSKYRNVSALSVTMPSDGIAGEPATTVLCDIGEGTLGQMWNATIGSRHPDSAAAAGAGTAPDALVAYVASIGMVFLSHMHADHHLGIFVFLRFRHARRASMAAAPLLIAAPSEVVRFCRAILGVFGAAACGAEGADYVFDVVDGVVGRLVPDAAAAAAGSRLSAFCAARGWESAVFEADHPAGAHGIMMHRAASPAAASCLYTGDTQPCPNIPRWGAGVAVLIHEATFAADKVHEARQRRHSTVDEAIAAGNECGAAVTLLTHFSQRYPKYPTLSDAPAAGAAAADGGQTAVCVGFDLMHLTSLGAARRRMAAPPAFQSLMAEYASWGEGTSKRLREAVDGGDDDDDVE
jgi:ribonuclease Z